MHYRPNFHLSPPMGRLNDPNGMFIQGGKLHVFYQHDPSFPATPKRTGWAHAAINWPAKKDTSPHELSWQHYPNALYPDAPYDAHGCYSGGAVVHDEDVWLFYTGNLKDGDRRIPSQNRVHTCLTDSPMGGTFLKDAANPLIPDSPDGFTGHFRDPHITRVETGDHDHPQWRMALGAQRNDQSPAIALYHSNDLKDWEFQGALEFDTSRARPGSSPDIIPGGYMWECPNLISMRDRTTGEDLDVLIFCPQGLEAVEQDGISHYTSSDQCGHIVGKLEGTSFTVLRGFSELDHGYEFYAPQIIGLDAAPHDEAVLVGWIGLPGNDDTPTLTDGWVHCLTLPRTISLENHQLTQKPSYAVPEVVEAASHRGSTLTKQAPLTDKPLNMTLIDASDTAALTVSWDPSNRTIRLTRPDAAPRTARLTVTDSTTELVMIADGCAVEVFAGHTLAMTSAVFGSPESAGQWKTIDVS